MEWGGVIEGVGTADLGHVYFIFLDPRLCCIVHGKETKQALVVTSKERLQAFGGHAR